jgi:hypothetical protein
VSGVDVRNPFMLDVVDGPVSIRTIGIPVDGNHRAAVFTLHAVVIHDFRMEPRSSVANLLHKVRKFWTARRDPIWTAPNEENAGTSMARAISGSGLIESHIEQMFQWANLSSAERRRQFDLLLAACIAYVAKTLRIATSPVLHGLPAPDPDELLIESLASAPGAPPALSRLHTTEGCLAA